MEDLKLFTLHCTLVKNAYESPSTTVDFNQRVLIPHIKYEGKMKKGSIEGKGKLYASDGWLAYDGEWKKDKYNGKGILYNQDGTIRKREHLTMKHPMRN